MNDSKEYSYWFEIGVLLMLLLTMGGGFVVGTDFEVVGSFSTSFFDSFIFWIKLLTVIIAIPCWVLIIYVLIEMNIIHPHEKRIAEEEEARRVQMLEEKDQTPTNEIRNIKGQWSTLEGQLERASDVEAPYLVIEADTIVDGVLKDMGFRGDTMGERMQHLSNTGFRNIDNLWEAHKLRNQIAHEGVSGVKSSDALHALHKYRKALKELGVI